LERIAAGAASARPLQILTCWDRPAAGAHGGWEEVMWRYRFYSFLRRKMRIAFLTFMCYAALC
jgi:hypothetical protein